MAEPRPILIFRLSSLGDVILATAALEALPDGAIADWVVAKEYEWLLVGHPRIRRVWTFDRKSQGLRDWLKLNLELQAHGYSQVTDLHRSLRTRVARWIWKLAPLISRNAGRDRVEWKLISKQRVRLYGFFALKGLWPAAFRPSAMVERVSSLVGGNSKSGRPDLKHLAARPSQAVDEVSAELKRLGEERFICVMPSSLWPGKRWSVQGFVDAVQKSGRVAVVLGAQSDQASHELVRELNSRGIPIISGVGRWNLADTAAVLALADACFGNDTGMAHLAEAVGTRAVTVFGPTVPEMGFGPWREESAAVGADLWCRPCGKDGRSCIRPIRRRLCLDRVPLESVTNALASKAPVISKAPVTKVSAKAEPKR